MTYASSQNTDTVSKSSNMTYNSKTYDVLSYQNITVQVVNQATWRAEITPMTYVSYQNITIQAVNTATWHAAVKTYDVRRSIQKFPDWVDKEMHADLWYYSLRSNTKGYGGKTH